MAKAPDEVELMLAEHLAILACRWPRAERRYFDAHARFFAQHFRPNGKRTCR